MIYLIDIFNVKFYIKVKNEEEQKLVDRWWEWFTADDKRGRISIILAFLKRAGIDYQYEWNWCKRLSVRENILAYIGFKKQINLIGREHELKRGNNQFEKC